MSIKEMSQKAALRGPLFALQQSLETFVILQLDLASSRRELRTHFACQLQIRRNKWNNSPIGQKLATENNYRGVVSFKMADDFPTNSTGIGLLDILGDRCTIHPFFSPDQFFTLLNANVSVDYVEREVDDAGQSHVWLVRATIHSGGLLFGGATDPSPGHDDIDPSFEARLWPKRTGERVTGIFFAGSELQIEVLKNAATAADKPTIRRFRLLGTHDRDGVVESAVWEQVPFASILTNSRTEDPQHRPYERQQPSQTIKATLDEVGKLGKLNHMYAVAGSDSGSVIAVVRDMHIKGGATRSEFLKIDWTLQFKLLGTQWRPRSLAIAKHSINGTATEGFLFSDVDEVDRVLRTGESSGDFVVGPDTVELTWLKAQPTAIQPKLPPAAFAGASSDNPSTALGHELWFLAKTEKSPYDKTPATWAHMSTREGPADPLDNSLRESRLTGEFTFNLAKDNAVWSTKVAPTLPQEQAEGASFGVVFFVTRNIDQAIVHLPRVLVTIDSPKFDFYRQPLNDPRSAPNERQPQLPERQQSGTLRFVFRSGADTSGTNEPFARCVLKSGQFVVQQSPRAIELFLPAEIALVDPVSVTRGNLVAQQIVAFSLIKKTVVFVKLEDRNVLVLEQRVNGTAVDFTSNEIAQFTTPGFGGYFLQLAPAAGSTKSRVVVRILPDNAALVNGAQVTLKIEPRPELADLDPSTTYVLAIGPTRLALPRDLNHGLIPIGLPEFWFDKIDLSEGRRPVLGFEKEKVQGSESQSVFALHPWTEWGPNPEQWTRTGRARLHHRNLIQEHAEFESSFEDRFPPEGPAADPVTGAIPTPLLPLGDFLRAVRDRYTEASGNLCDKSPTNLAKSSSLHNWLDLPGRTKVFKQKPDGSFEDAKPTVTFDRSAELPVAKLSPVEIFETQSLKLRNPNDPGADLHWLDASVRVKSIGIGAESELHLSATDASDVAGRRVLDSASPLLFGRHEISALAAVDVPGTDQMLLISGGPESVATAYLFAGDGRIVVAEDLKKIIVEVAFSRRGAAAGDAMRGVAILKDESLVRFELRIETLPTGRMRIVFDDAAVNLNGEKPLAVAGNVVSAGARFAVLSIKTGVRSVSVVDATNGTRVVLPADKTVNATAICMGLDGGSLRVAIGETGGSAKILTQQTGSWAVIDLPKRELQEDEKRKNETLKPIRSLRLSEGPVVVACDGSSFVSVWRTEQPDHAQVFPFPADVLRVALGQADLDRRANSSAAVLFAVALRSGELRIFQTKVNDTSLTPLRIFDAASEPVLNIAMPFREKGKSAPCFVGTSAGTVLGWEICRGVEWPDAPIAMPKQKIVPVDSEIYFDALGVVRRRGKEMSGPVTIDVFSLGVKKYFSISTAGLTIAQTPGNSVASSVSEFRFWADALAVPENGQIEPMQFPDGPFAPGRFGCFSTITASDPTSNLSTLDFLPRLAGVPYFVTNLLRVELAPPSSPGAIPTDLIRVQAEGVLINPDEVAAGQDPADAGTLPGIVARAVSRGKTVVVDFRKNGSNWSPPVVSGGVDWPMSVNRQIPDRDALDGFPGRVARLVGNTVRLKPSGRLSIQIALDQSQALVFGRLWPFVGTSLEVLADSSFESVEGADGTWRQRSFEVHTDDVAGETLAVDHSWPMTGASSSVVVANPLTMAWGGGRFFVQHGRGQVCLGDRTTGLASTASAKILGQFDQPSGQFEFPVAGILETVESVGPDNVDATMVTVATPTKVEGQIRFCKFAPSLLSDPSLEVKTALVSSAITGGPPRVRFGRDRRGVIESGGKTNGFARFKAAEGSPLPADGERIQLSVEPKIAHAYRVSKKNRTFELATLLGSGISGDIFLQYCHRIETANRSQNIVTLKLSGLPVTWKVNDQVRIIRGTGAASAGNEIEIGKVEAIEPLRVSGIAGEPAGARLQKLGRVETEATTAPTVRIKTDAKPLIDSGTRFLLIHDNASTHRLHLADNITATGFDLYLPGKFGTPPDPQTKVVVWREVHDLTLAAGATEASIDVGTIPLDPFATIQIFDAIGDVSLNGGWTAIAVPGGAAGQFLLAKEKAGDNAGVTGGEWKRSGDTVTSPIASIDNTVSPILVTTAAPHLLTSGEAVEISGVVGSPAPLGAARIRVQSATTFELFRVGAAPTTATTGSWERSDQDAIHKITDVKNDSVPAVLTAQTQAPLAGLRFRVLAAGAGVDGVFVAGPTLNDVDRASSDKQWEMWRGVETVTAQSTWSAFSARATAAIAPASAGIQRTTLTRTRGGFPATGQLALAYDGKAVSLPLEPFRVFGMTASHGFAAQEFRGTPDTARFIPWTTAVSYVVAGSSGAAAAQLKFDFVPDFSTPPALRGSTHTHAEGTAIESLEIVDVCGPLAGASDGKRLFVWDLSVPMPDVAPALTLGDTVIPAGKKIQALNLHEHDGNHFLAALWEQTVLVRMLPVGPAVQIAVPKSMTGSLSFSSRNGELILLVAGHDHPSTNFLKALRLSVSGGNLALLPSLWENTTVTETILTMAAGQVGDAPFVLLGTKTGASGKHIESWSPTMALRVRSEGESPNASLPINFGALTIAEQLVTGRLALTRRVIFEVKRTGGIARALARLQQGNYQCLLIDPTSSDGARGLSSLMIWPMGDLSTESADPALDKLRLAAAMAELKLSSAHITTSKPVTLKVGSASVQVNDGLIVQSLLTFNRVDPLVTTAHTSRSGALAITIPLANSVLTLLLEGDTQSSASSKDFEMTGLLVLEAGGQPKLETVVRCGVTLRPADHSLENLTIVNDVFWSTFVDPPSVADKDPQILLATPDAAVAYDVLAPRIDENVPQTDPFKKLLGFFRLTIQSSPRKLMLNPVKPDSVPLIPELEPSRLQPPEKLDAQTVRLSHRRRGGLVMRPNLPQSRWTAVSVTLAEGQPIDPLTSRRLLLENVLAFTTGDDGFSLTRIRQDGWLVRLAWPPATSPGDPPPSKFRTDGLFVVNADFPGGGVTMVSGVEARTQVLGQIDLDRRAERRRYREILRDQGTQGLAVQYSLIDDNADISYVDSPFYDNAGEAETNPFTSLAAPSGGVGSSAPALVAPALAPVPGPSPAPSLAPLFVGGSEPTQAVDPRLILPRETAVRVPATPATSTRGRFFVQDLAFDPNADVCCLAHRYYRLARSTPESLEAATTPILHVAEVPAFRQPARLQFPLRDRWRFSPNPTERPFFPTRLDWELAADKPGAMFQILAQARLSGADGEVTYEPQIDFALREPQFIRMKDCVTAEVHLDPPTKLVLKDSHIAATLEWTEVVGASPIEGLATGDDWLVVRDERFELNNPPVQLIVEFNGDVLAINPADAAVPAYRIEAQKSSSDIRAPQIKTRPAATYLVAQQPVKNLFAPFSVVTSAPRLIVTRDVAPPRWTATVAPNSTVFASATRLRISGHSNFRVNTSHRLVETASATFTLMQDTVLDNPGDTASVSKKVTLVVEGVTTPVTGTILCFRPFCLNLKGLPGDRKSFKITAIALEGSATDLRIRSLASATKLAGFGSPIGDGLHLASIVNGGADFLVVTPTVVAGVTGAPTTETVEAKNLRTNAVPYLEVAARRKEPINTDITTEPNVTWNSSLSLPNGIDGLLGITANSLIHIGDVKLPHAGGVFQLLPAGTKRFLARPSVAPISTVTPTGTEPAEETWRATQIDFANPSANPSPVPLATVHGGSPIVIETATAPTPAWEDNTPIVVANVAGLPEANGAWVVRKLSSNTFALYEPVTVGTSDGAPIKLAAVSVVAPLQKTIGSPVIAFKESSEPNLATLDPDALPPWEPTDRPFLQLYWSGSAEAVNDDGAGIPWRPSGAVVQLYQEAKQVKFLANSQLSPKLAFVLIAKKSGAAQLQRTILFGDSAPPSLAVAKLSADKKLFILEIPENREILSIQLPDPTGDAATIYLIKSLPSGALVYDKKENLPYTH